MQQAWSYLTMNDKGLFIFVIYLPTHQISKSEGSPSRSLWLQNYFHKNKKALSAFFTVLMIQKQ